MRTPFGEVLAFQDILQRICESIVRVISERDIGKGGKGVVLIWEYFTYGCSFGALKSSFTYLPRAPEMN